MREIVLASALSFAVMVSGAFAAEPVMLTNAEMDSVTAGQPINAGGIQVAALNNVNANVQAAVPAQAGVCALVSGCEPDFAPQDVVNRSSLR